jgi:hypothetical protein
VLFETEARVQTAVDPLDGSALVVAAFSLQAAARKRSEHAPILLQSNPYRVPDWAAIQPLEKELDWAWQCMDGAMTKAPSGGEKTGKNPTDRAKSGGKRSLLTEGHGIPIAVAVAGAKCHDKKLVAGTLRSLVVQRPRVTKSKPQNRFDLSGFSDKLLVVVPITQAQEPTIAVHP